MTARPMDQAPFAGGRHDLPPALRQKHRREAWAAALLVCLLSAILYVSGALEPFENRLIEARARLLDRAPTQDVAIVEIDAKSLHVINSWPWSRRHHAQLIDRLAADGASMIAFDVDFSAHADKAGDQALGHAVKKFQPVILPIFQQRASDSSEAMVKSRPANMFGSAWVGGVNIIPGHDGVVRDFPAATMIGGQIQPAMAALLADNGALGDRTFIPDWSIDVRKIPRFSFIDVIEGRVPPRSIAGKRVIVGATAIELGDRYTIPRFGTVPGVVVQALAAETLIQHRALRRSGPFPTFAGLFAISLLIGSTFSVRRGAVLCATVFATLVTMPVLIQAAMPLTIDTAPLLFAGLGGALLRAIVEARHRIRVDAIHDRETGLPNEQALEATLEGTITVASIDRFEAIRTAIGSTSLAEAIVNAAARIEQAVGVAVYRVAPDSLAWVVSHECDPEELAARIGNLFSAAVITARGPIDVQWTFGMTSASAESAVGKALAAVNMARNEGRAYSWYRSAPSTAVRDLSIMGELRRGLDEGQLFVVYQAKLALKTGSTAQAEALIRWDHPTEGAIAPDRFLPLAEETGAVRDITRFVLRHALADMASSSTTPFAVSINVSAADIGDIGFADQVIEALGAAQVDPGRLTLEITESAIIRSKENALMVLERLREHGVRLSIDDYGTGQSTLSYVKTLPVHELKIDRGFVTSLRENHADRIMVRSTIDLAHALGLTVVAEGVEDWDTVKLLTDLGCDYAQGFVIGRGLRIEEFLSLASASTRKAA